MKPTIKNTLSSSFKRHGHISVMVDHAEAVGYPFIEWNGRVYRIKPRYPVMITEGKLTRIPPDVEDMNILYKDLK